MCAGKSTTLISIVPSSQINEYYRIYLPAPRIKLLDATEPAPSISLGTGPVNSICSPATGPPTFRKEITA